MGDRGRRGDEMRPVTALFADIVGSTGLGERLGPDEVKALVGEFVTRMSHAVEELGGVVQAYMGDGICAYFGVPAAHEDDPERAARAALRILAIAAGYAAEVEAAWGIEGFDVRVGLNSGPAAVGLVGGREEQTVALGDTTNVAARLQSAARPGTVAVGSGTARRLADRFLVEPLGPVRVKGRDEPVDAWSLVGPRSADEPRPMLPLVGRDREMERLHGVAADLAAGRGQVLVILGDAGLGKTRMLSELRAIVGDAALWAQGRCSSYGADVPYQPFVRMLRTWLGVDEADAELVVRTKLRARVGAFLDDGDGVVALLSLLLGIRIEPDVERDLLSLSSDELVGRIRAAYVRWLGALADARPLVVAVDDLNWADRSTRELAEEVLLLSDRAPMLIAVTMRPDPSSEAWPFRMRASAEFGHREVEVSLSPLDRSASRALVDAFLPPGVLAPHVRDDIVDRAEGNPLYLEELLRAILEAGGMERHKTWTISPASVSDLPPALEALLVARIDRLPDSPRRLAQIAAVIGRTFPVDVLRRIAGTDQTDEELAVLLRGGIVREVQRYPELVCAFHHGLLQEASLSTLTPSALRELNRLVGEALEALHADRLDEHAEALAFHFYRSDEEAKALGYLERAAERAADAPHALELLARARKVAERTADNTAQARIDERVRALTE